MAFGLVDRPKKPNKKNRLHGGFQSEVLIQAVDLNRPLAWRNGRSRRAYEEDDKEKPTLQRLPKSGHNSKVSHK